MTGASCSNPPGTVTSLTWREVIPATGDLPDLGNGARIAPGAQEIAFTSPESALDTSLTLVHAMRGRTEAIAELFPLLGTDLELILPGPPAKSDGEVPPPPVVIPLADISALNPQAAADAVKVPVTRLIGALIQSAVLRSSGAPTPQTPEARRLAGWLHGLSPLEAYLVHSVLLGGRVPRAARMQMAGLSGLSRAAQLNRSLGGLLAADPELVGLFEMVYRELNPLAARDRAIARVPQLGERMILGDMWGAATEFGPTVGRLIGTLHPELDTADGWLLVNRAKRGMPHPTWTVRTLRRTQREMTQQLLRTGSATLPEVREVLAKAKVPLAHDDDLEEWLDYLDIRRDGNQLEVAPDTTPSAQDSAASDEGKILNLAAAFVDETTLSSMWGPLLGTSIYPDATAKRHRFTYCDCSSLAQCTRSMLDTPLAEAYSGDPYIIAEETSRLFNIGLDQVTAETVPAADPLAALEQLGVPATALLTELDSLLTGPLALRVALHLHWAVDRARGGGVNPTSFAEAKYDLTAALLRHPATLGHTEPATAWARLSGTAWWRCAAWEEEHPGTAPTVAEVRRGKLLAGLGPNVLRALESDRFRAEVNARLRRVLAVQATAGAAGAVNKQTVERATATTPGTVRDLHEWETELAQRLAGQTLVAAADLSAAEMTELRAALAPRLAKVVGDAATTTEFVQRYPASMLVAMVGVASLHAAELAAGDPARASAAILTELGLGVTHPVDDVATTPTAADAIAAQLRPMLRELGLEELAELPAGQVAKVLVAHAGLPVASASMDALVDALTEFTATVPDRSAQKVRPWLLDPSQRDFLLALPAGTQALLRHNAAASAELLEDALDLVENLGTDAQASPDDGEVGAALPQLVREALATAVAAGEARNRLAAGRAADRPFRPYLMLDGTNAVCVALPPVAETADEPWVVVSGDEVTQVRPRRTLGARETQLSLLSRPARRVAVLHPSFHSVVELRLFTTEFPVAVFHLDGRQVPTSSLVPATQVLALIPPGHEVLAESGGPAVLEVLDPPEGWGQWSLHLWDLDGVARVDVQDAAGVRHGITVGSRELPSLWDTPEEPLEHLVGVCGPTGEPVLAVRPWLSVPPLAAGERPWTVWLRRAGTEQWLGLGSYAPADRHEGHPLFDDDVLTSLGLDPSAPLLGAFDVRVEGPDHARVDIPVFVAEGFYAHYPHSPRLPAPKGATPCVAELSAEPAAEGEGTALEIATGLLEFPTDVRTLKVAVTAGERTETLSIRPPRLEFRMTGRGMAPAWSDQQISRTPFDFEDATIVVRDPYATLHVALHLVNSTGRLVQRAEFDRTVDGTFRVDTRRFADKIKALRTGELRAQIIDPEAEGTRHYKRVVPLVRFAAVEEQHITLDGHALRVSGAEVADDLVCRVWQLERPWLPVLSLPVRDEGADLGSELSGAGRLRVDAVVEDPWDPVPASPLPHRGSTSLQMAGRFSTTALGLLAQFLAGRGAASFIAHGLPETWNSWALLGLGLHQSTDRPLRAELGAHVRLAPRAELLGLDRSSLTSQSKVAAFIASGLVNMPIEPPPPGGDSWDRAAAGARRSVAATSRPREAWIDLLTSIATIPTLSGQAHTRALNHLQEVGGESLLAVLAFGQDPLQSAVRLGLPEVQAALDPMMRQILLSRPTIPGPLLDAGSRWEGLLALLRNEGAFDAGYVRDQFERMLGKYDSLRRFRPLYKLITERIKALPATVEVEAPRRRRGGRGRVASQATQALEVPMWANIPQLTYSLALLARGHAYGYLKHGVDPDLLELWSRLVAQAPQQIVIDLVLAEAHVAHLRHGGAMFLTADARGAAPGT